MIATPAHRLTPVNLIAIAALAAALATVAVFVHGRVDLLGAQPAPAPPVATPGPAGPMGPAGPEGARGAPGKAGTAQAFATIDTSSATTARVQPATPGRGVTEVTHPATGVYCVRFDPAKVTSGTPVIGNAAEVVGITVTTTWTGQSVQCPTNMLEVLTYDTATAMLTDVTFHLIVP